MLAFAPAIDLGGVSLLGDPWLDASLLLLAGLAAGVVNVMAGGGSFLLFPILVGLGLPSTVANGTMRLGVISQSATAALTFRRKGVEAFSISAKLAPAMVIGALAGSWMATQISDAAFRPLIGIVLLAWALVLIVKPDRFLHPPDQELDARPITHAFALAIGIYAGFLQAGVGFPLLALLSGHLGYDLVRANASKVLLTLVSTLLALPLFIFADQIAWTPAIVIALGTMLGAWIGARWQIHKGGAVVRWFVVVMVAISGAAMLASSV